MFKYTTLLVKMGLDMTGGLGQKGNADTGDNFDLLCDVEMLFCLACFIPLVNAVHSLMKLSQSHDIFVCDFMQAVKVCQHELAQLFVDASTAYGKEDFLQYCALISLENEDIRMQWRPLPGDSGVSHLVFHFGLTTIYARCHGKEAGAHIFVTHQDFYRAQDTMECQFSCKTQFFLSSYGFLFTLTFFFF